MLIDLVMVFFCWLLSTFLYEKASRIQWCLYFRSEDKQKGSYDGFDSNE